MHAAARRSELGSRRGAGSQGRSGTKRRILMEGAIHAHAPAETRPKLSGLQWRPHARVSAQTHPSTRTTSRTCHSGHRTEMTAQPSPGTDAQPSHAKARPAVAAAAEWDLEQRLRVAGGQRYALDVEAHALHIAYRREHVHAPRPVGHHQPAAVPRVEAAIANHRKTRQPPTGSRRDRCRGRPMWPAVRASATAVLARVPQWQRSSLNLTVSHTVQHRARRGEWCAQTCHGRSW